jgi:uncharacterized delta-60 repeat protein
LNEIALVADGKILVSAGSVLARYDAAGDLDAGYGSGGVVTLPACIGDASFVDLLVRADGSTLVSGGSDDSCVVRLAASGAFDASFGAAGIATVENFSIAAIAMQGDKVVLSGFDGALDRASVWRLLSDGERDSGFANPVLADAGVFWVLVVNSDGTIYAADDNTRVVHLLANGKLDVAFGSGGVTSSAIEPDPHYAVLPRAMAIQPDGRIVVAGDFAYFAPMVPLTVLLRYDVDGTVDASFGTDGEQVSTGQAVGAMTLQPDGKIVVATSDPAVPALSIDAAVHVARHFGTVPSCPASAMIGCHGGTVPAGGKLRMDDPTDNPKAKLQWSWTKVAETTAVDFGDPVGTDDYTLCVYDESSGSTLAAGAKIPAGGLCKGKPCWKSHGASGFAYTDSKRTRYGISSIKLKAGVAGKAQITLKGQGATLPVAELPAPLPLRVQLLAENGQCWESVFSTTGTTRNDAGRYQGKSD